MISVLSLVVAILAVFFGPLIARANVQRQLQVAAREAWMREFREQVAAMLTSRQALGRRVSLLGRTAVDDPEQERQRDALYLAFDQLRLLLAEKGAQHETMLETANRLVQEDYGNKAEPWHKFAADAADILRHERAAIVADLGVWREIRISLGLAAAVLTLTIAAAQAYGMYDGSYRGNLIGIGNNATSCTKVAPAQMTVTDDKLRYNHWDTPLSSPP
jgi:hypothetical protein